MANSSQLKSINFEDFKFDFSGGDVIGHYAIDRPVFEWKSRRFLKVKVFKEDNRERAEKEMRFLRKLQGCPYFYAIFGHIRGFEKYDYAVDMWAAGCILAGSIFHTKRIFNAKEDHKQLFKIANILGGKELLDSAREYEIAVDKELERNIRKFKGLGFQSLKRKYCEITATEEAIDLVEKLLVYDHKKRLTAKEALNHPYFSKIHKENLGEMEGTTKDTIVEQLSDLINKQLSISEEDNYPEIDISRELGSGTYGVVYYASVARSNYEFAVKHPFTISQIGFARKIKILDALKGCPNVNRFLGSIIWDTFCSLQNTFFLVFEYVNETSWYAIYDKISSEELRNYLRQMFTALDGCHSRGIMHCDIKPNWGLSTFYEENAFYNTGIGSIPYLSPELLLNYPKYNYSVDIWPMGCIVASAIFRKKFLFDGTRQDYLLEEILKVFGSECFLQFCRDYHINIHPEQVDRRYLGHQRKDWSKFITDENREIATAEAVDLVKKLLVFDPRQRLTAKQALKHDYFKLTLRTTSIQVATQKLQNK
ncbi:unnamed protein product [Hymenolepis diminuta]|uniref:non-specific serine/threonine protein kinase n=1 Tax=Hymenolepis diminuta TaxID=6216 RepID=A0A0R3SQB4_HYMDI|nr:unnamed protein product [Hymenolepis diminuta]